MRPNAEALIEVSSVRFLSTVLAPIDPLQMADDWGVLHGRDRPCRAKDAALLASRAWVASNFNGPARLVFLFGSRPGGVKQAKQSKATQHSGRVPWLVWCLGSLSDCLRASTHCLFRSLGFQRRVSLHRRLKERLLVPSFCAYPRFRLLRRLSEAVSPFWA